jgi:DNA invertase Pin-like site-specific DNA recombinase
MTIEIGTEHQVPAKVEAGVRCAIYARSATSQGSESINAQLSQCREAAERKGWVVLEQYLAVDQGQSGNGLSGREAFQTLIAAAKMAPQPFDCILLSRPDRLGQNIASVFTTIETLHYLGVFLYFADMDLDSRSNSFGFMLTQTALTDEMHRWSVIAKAGVCPCAGCAFSWVPLSAAALANS